MQEFEHLNSKLNKLIWRFFITDYYFQNAFQSLSADPEVVAYERVNCILI